MRMSIYGCVCAGVCMYICLGIIYAYMGIYFIYVHCVNSNVKGDETLNEV